MPGYSERKIIDRESHIDDRLEQEGLGGILPKRVSEWTEGRRRLNFEKPFSGGILRATEDENGIASFKILDNADQQIFDFQTLTPDFKFVTPTYQRNLRPQEKEIPSEFELDLGIRKEKKRGQWACDFNNKLILIGEFSEKGILALLHEIGHSKLDGEMWYSKLKETGGEVSVKERAKLKSELERAVWAEAFGIARELRDDEELRLNLFEGFSNQEELWKYVYASLSAHRYSAEYQANGMWGVLWADLRNKPLKNNFPELKNLFDKRKLVRKKEERK